MIWWLGVVVLVAVQGFVAHTASRPELRPAFVGLVALGSALVLVLYRHRRAPLGLPLVLGVAIVLRALVFPLLPTLSDDAFRYVWDGLLQAEGLNPFLLRPDAPALATLREAGRFAQLNSPAFFSVYPPVSQLTFWVGSQIGSTWEAHYYAIKGVATTVELGGLAVVGRLVGGRALLLYAWHPLVAVEVAGQAHTEALLVGLVFVALYAWSRRRPAWAGAAIAAAGWVKLFPFGFLPLLGGRKGWRWGLPAVLVAGLLALPYAHPEVVGNVRSSLDLYVRYFEFNAGPYYAVKGVMRFFTGEDWSKQIGPLFRWMLLLSVPVLYAVAYRWRWPLWRGVWWVSGLVLFWSTTVHPWYLLLPLALVPFAPAAAAPWFWLAACSAGTYLVYTHDVYWPFVWLGWGGFGLLMGWRHRRDLLAAVQRLRAEAKVRQIAGVLPSRASRPVHILDLGAGEGYVGEAIARRTGAQVMLADVRPSNRTDLPFTLVEGRLPFEDERFDATVLYYVLHHAADPERVVREALRVTRGPVIIAESVFDGPVNHAVLRFLDVWANRLRSGGAMRAQEEHLCFRTVDGWQSLFGSLGAHVERTWRRGRWLHRRAYFVLGK